MDTPIRGIRFIHRAILAETASLSRLAAEGNGKAIAERLPFVEKVFHLHNAGEEAAIFPDLDARASEVVPAYLIDHGEEKRLFDDLRSACDRGDATLPQAAGALGAHVRLHIKKEEELIVPLVERLFSIPEQAAQVGKMMGQFSPADMGQVLPWMITSLEVDDRRAYLAMVEKVAPPERFAGVLGMVRAGVTPDVWASLER